MDGQARLISPARHPQGRSLRAKKGAAAAAPLSLGPAIQ
ncbi:hypothetical protein ANT2_0793 [plant metagenome]|uniref:Uncharacterized protein n=1 Tax=plant metagenome TaxID=1297885 RepID=A0A484R7D0_9ZZZZ